LEWITLLSGATVGLDTAPLIYFIEENPSHISKLQPFFEAAERGEFRLVTSVVTLIEVLVQPLRSGRADVADEYRDILLRSTSLTTVPLTKEIADEAARLRAFNNLRTPDAIHLGTAIQSGASWFLTNDAGLPKLPGLSMLLVDRLPSTAETDA
jgi:predicted nucleic acid-binding protein